MTRLIDFDAYRREREGGEPVSIQIGGRVYDLPAEMPASVALEVIALRQELGESADVPPERIHRIAEQLFGRDVLRELTDEHRLSMPELAVLIQQVFGEYNRPAPNRTTRRKGPGAAAKRK